MVLYYNLTTHVQGDKDQALLRDLADRVAFPTVLYLTPDGKVLHRHVGDRTARSFKKEIHGYYRLHQARKDFVAGDDAAAIIILKTELQLGLLKHAAAQKKYANLDQQLLEKHGEQRAGIQRALVRLEAQEVYFGLVKGKVSADRDRNRAKRAHVMLQAGRIPDDDNAWRFWKLILLHAQQIKSLKLFDRAWGEYQELRKGTISPEERERIEAARKKLAG